MLETSSLHFEITYAGPDEDVQISAETLSGMDVFVQPGGPDLDGTWPMMEPHKEAVRDFVADGGTFLGFCVSAGLPWTARREGRKGADVVRFVVVVGSLHGRILEFGGRRSRDARI